MLGDLNIAEPKALVGFAGPLCRTIVARYAANFPDDKGAIEYDRPSSEIETGESLAKLRTGPSAEPQRRAKGQGVVVPPPDQEPEVRQR